MPVVVKVCFHSLVYFCSIGIKTRKLSVCVFSLLVQSNDDNSASLVFDNANMPFHVSCTYILVVTEHISMDMYMLLQHS
jgi:hypothetical protein